MRLFLALLLILTSHLALADQFIVEPDRGRAPVLDFIKQAKHRLNLVMYDFTDKTILDALLQAKTNGVTVNCLLEKTPYKNEGINTGAMSAFNRAHLNWQGGDPRYQYTHQKTLVSDDQQALIMTFNFTVSSFKNQRNFGVVIDNPEEVKAITEVFNADWNRHSISPLSTTLLFSPVNSRSGYLQWIRRAKQSLLIYMQSLADNDIAEAIGAAADRGVSVNIITSKLPQKRILDRLNDAGVKIHLSKKLYIHAKALLIDHQTAIIGSVNFTPTSLDQNRELALVSTDANVVQGLNATFTRDWNGEGMVFNQPTSRYRPRVHKNTWARASTEKRAYRFLKKLFN